MQTTQNTYKIIFLDIDGTLTDSHKRIMPETLKALMNVQKNGVRLAIASGRPSKGVLPYAEELQLDKYAGYILPFNGGQIINYQTKETVYENTLTMDIIKMAYNISKEYNTELITYQGDCILSETDDNPYLKIESEINKMDVIKVPSLLDAIKEMPVKCLMLGDGDYLGKIESEIKEKMGHDANVFRSEPFFMEIVPNGIDKAAAMEVLIDKIGIKQSETMAFGDGYNDISMVEYAGLGVAMSNGCNMIKQVADRIADDNNSEGIAKIIAEVF